MTAAAIDTAKRVKREAEQRYKLRAVERLERATWTWRTDRKSPGSDKLLIAMMKKTIALLQVKP